MTTIIIDILRVIHIITAILMAWPAYALVAVNQRVRLGPPLGDRTDTYIENIIKNRSIPCFVFQGTAGVTGLALVLLRRLGLDALVTNAALGLKSLLLVLVVGLLSYVHFNLQPQIDALFAQAGSPAPASQTPGIHLHVRGTDHFHVGGAGLDSLPTVADGPAGHSHRCLHLANLQ